MGKFRKYQRIWNEHHPEDPFELNSGYVIHHIDHDRSNNDISNLTKMTLGEHSALHNKTRKWKKESREERTFFYDSEGEEIEFNAGTTWIEIVPTDRDIVYN